MRDRSQTAAGVWLMAAARRREYGWQDIDVLTRLGSGHRDACPAAMTISFTAPGRLLRAFHLSLFTFHRFCLGVFAAWREIFLFAKRLTRSLQVDAGERFWYSATARFNRENTR
jgi:hypothetical protein